MPTKYTTEDKEKMLSNKHLRTFATDLNICPTCSNCRLYDRSKGRCRFDNADIYNQNELNTYCEWWVPMRWIIEKFRKQFPYCRNRLLGLDWIESKEELYRRKELVKRNEEGEQTIVFSDKPVVVDNQNSPSNELSTEVNQNNNQSKNTTKDDKRNKTQELRETRLWQIFETYLNILSH